MRRVTLVLFILAIACQLYAQMSGSASLAKQLGKPPRFALVLSGGGARGIAHIGVLDVLDSAGIKPDLIIGTSMGAVIGGFYAAGYSPKELEKFVLETDWADVFDLEDDSKRMERSLLSKDESNAILSMRFTGFFKPVLPKAIASGQRLTMLLNSYAIRSPLGTQDDFIKDFRIPFVALSTDIVTGERILFTHGDLTSALRASSTVPLRFNPVSMDSALLVDGGLLANIPVDVAKDSAGAEFIVAVNTTSALRRRYEVNSPVSVADQVVSLMMRHENDKQMRLADIVITPDSLTASDDFTHIEKIIESGRNVTRRQLASIKASLRKLPEEVSSPDENTAPLLPVLVDLRIYGAADHTQELTDLTTRAFRGTAVTNTSCNDQICRSILSSLRTMGYSLARVDSVRVVKKYSRLEIFINRGYISSVSVKGGEVVDQEQVKRIFPLSVGDIFRSDISDKGLRDLTATGYFSFASLDVDEPHGPTSLTVISGEDSTLFYTNTNNVSGGASLRINVEERAMNVLRLGLLADNEFGAVFSGEYANENIFGLDAEFSLKGGIGSLTRYAVASISSPRFLSLFSTFLIQGYSSFTDISVYDTKNNIPDGTIESSIVDVNRETNDIGSRLRLGGEVAKRASLSAELRAEAWRSVSTQTKNTVTPRQWVNAFRGEFLFDSRDDADYPNEGTYLKTYYELASKSFGSDVSYTKLFAQFTPSITISRLHTLIPSVALGVADNSMLQFQYFSLGGMNSFYGLNEYEKRGRQMVQGSMTYQVKLPYIQLFPTYFSVRYDLGATWLEPEQIKFSAFVHGIGAQFGFKTPIGLVRFGIGENFAFANDDKKPLLLNTPRFYFSIGAKL